ncbi:MAG: MFS transporter [Acidimicrobiia bacterium]|nr:MFS transporter [Acidimicrobiia bacterium]
MTSTAEWRPTRLSTAAWAVYDLANTIFALGVSSLYFPQWLTQNGDDLPSWLGASGSVDLALALAINAAMLVVIVLGPWIGARSDHFGSRRHYLIPLTLLAVVPTFFIATAPVPTSLLLFSLALVGFNLGSVVYDALLPDVSTPETIGRVSGIGIGVGYVGSFIAVGVGAVLLDTVATPVAAQVTVELERTTGHPSVFRTIAVLFLLFAIPTFLFVRERPRRREAGAPPRFVGSVRRLVESWRRARRYEGVARFLVGRFFYSDAINTLIGGFLTIYVIEELAFTDSEVQVLLAVAIGGAIVGGLGGGRVVDRAGPRALLHATLHAWMVAIALGIVAGAADVRVLAWPLGVLGGLALGATWAADRVYMQVLSPPRYLGEFYGLYATVGRFATILGPLVWGLVVTVAGLPREAALGTLIGFLVVARVVLAGVDDRPRAWTSGDRSA